MGGSSLSSMMITIILIVLHYIPLFTTFPDYRFFITIFFIVHLVYTSIRNCTLLNLLTLYCFRHLQDYPVRPLTHTLALTHPYVRTPLNNELELLPPLQHVVGTIYPAVDAGPGFRFPISQLLNHTPPPNLVHWNIPWASSSIHLGN